MSNDNSINTDSSSTISLNANVRTLGSDMKNKAKKIIIYLKPNIFNIILTFISFLLSLFLSRKLGLSLGIALISYFLFSILLHFIQKNKLIENLPFQFIKNSNDNPNVLDTKSNKVLLLAQNRKIIAIALVKLEWPSNYVSIYTLLNFFLEEGIQIQDCREGCYLIFRKNIEIKRTVDMKEQTIKLVKEIEKTILLTRKKLEIEFDFIQLSLVKGKENILTILNLGLSPEKFNLREELSEEDFEALRKTSQLLVSE